MTSAAKLGDRVLAVDTHIALVASPGGPVATPTPSPFSGPLLESLSATVMADNLPLALVCSVALNLVPHPPVAGPFQTPPSNRATVKTGSASVLADGKRVARHGDTATTCNDPEDAPQGVISAQSTVKVG